MDSFQSWVGEILFLVMDQNAKEFGWYVLNQLHQEITSYSLVGVGSGGDGLN